VARNSQLTSAERVVVCKRLNKGKKANKREANVSYLSTLPGKQKPRLGSRMSKTGLLLLLQQKQTRSLDISQATQASPQRDYRVRCHSCAHSTAKDFLELFYRHPRGIF
jgi:hypothetical protein